MNPASAIEKLTQNALDPICRELSSDDPVLGRAYEKHGAPPLWDREPGFETLVRIILEQQVSLASARAAFEKLKEAIPDVTPENVLGLSDVELRDAYFSRQKARYVRCLAEAVEDGSLDLESLHSLENGDVREALTKITGIGRWTSDIYLLMALLRLDVMPRGDIALYQSWKELAELQARPSPDDFHALAERWRPFRSVAARLLWHSYLSERASS